MPQSRREIARSLLNIQATQSFFGQQTNRSNCSASDHPPTVGSSQWNMSLSITSPQHLDNKTVSEMMENFTPAAYARFMNRFFKDGSLSQSDAAYATVCKSLDTCCTFLHNSGFKDKHFKPITTFAMKTIVDIIKAYETSSVDSLEGELHGRGIVLDEFKEVDEFFREQILLGPKVAKVVQTVYAIERLVFLQHDRNIQLILTCIRPLQLFNVEKRFGFVEESFAVVDTINQSEPGISERELPMSFRQMFNDPASAAVKVVSRLPLKQKGEVQGKIKGKKDDKSATKEKKKVPSLIKEKRQELEAVIARVTDAVALYKQSCEEATKMVENASNDIKNKRVRLPKLPKRFQYMGADVPVDIPKEIRRSLFDLDFLEKDIIEQLTLVSAQYSKATSVIGYWFNTSPEAWKYGKEHRHQMPSLREYEYNRTALRASSYTAAREYSKINRFFQEWSGLLTPELAYALKIDGVRVPEEIANKMDEKKMRGFQGKSLDFDSVDFMVGHLDKMVHEETKRMVNEKKNELDRVTTTHNSGFFPEASK